MKNTENAFSSFKQLRYLTLHIGSNRDSFKVFRLFSIYLKDKAFKYLKNQSFFIAIPSNISYVPRQWKRR